MYMCYQATSTSLIRKYDEAPYSRNRNRNRQSTYHFGATRTSETASRPSTTVMLDAGRSLPRVRVRVCVRGDDCAKRGWALPRFSLRAAIKTAYRVLRLRVLVLRVRVGVRVL